MNIDCRQDINRREGQTEFIIDCYVYGYPKRPLSVKYSKEKNKKYENITDATITDLLFVPDGTYDFRISVHIISPADEKKLNYKYDITFEDGKNEKLFLKLNINDNDEA